MRLEDVMLADGPLAYLPMLELGGSTAKSLGSVAVDGSWAVAPVFGVVPAPGGGRAPYLGASPYVTLADNNAWSLGTTGSLCVEAWVKPTAAPGSVACIIGKGHGAGDFEWNLFHDGSAGGAVTEQGYTANVYQSDGNVYLDGRENPDTVDASNYSAVLHRWAHVQWDMRTSGGLQIYVNDRLVISNVTSGGSIVNGTHAVGIGARGNGAIPFIGSICHVAIYGAILPAARRRAHIAAALRRPTRLPMRTRAA